MSSLKEHPESDFAAGFAAKGRQRTAGWSRASLEVHQKPRTVLGRHDEN